LKKTLSKTGSENVNTYTLKATYLGLLHEIGRILDRKSLETLIDDEEILNDTLRLTGSLPADADLPSNSILHLVKMADRIVTRAELRPDESQEVKKADKNINPAIPLSSVFNNLKGNKLSFYYQPTPLAEEINYPTDIPGFAITSNDYRKLADKLKKELSDISFGNSYVNALLSVLEANLSCLPSNTMHMDTADIPLYDHCKLTAAIASCIQEYLSYSNRTEYRFEPSAEDSFYAEKAFLMFSGDFSGIQSFIYNIVSDGALKSLRSRSFFLELTMEHIVDEILEAGGVSRANLIYSGGGHCYILLPNTPQVKENIDMLLKTVNKWLRDGFGTRLYYAWAYTECSANDLMNIPSENAPYEQIFRNLSRQLSAKKMHRYTPEELMELNSATKQDGIRECRICGTEDRLDKDDDICHWCGSFEKLSGRLLQKDLVILVSAQENPECPYIKLPSLSGELYCYFTDVTDAVKLYKEMDIKRFYTKNRSYPQLPNGTKLYMGDYVFDTRIEKLLSEDGMQRIAVLRADVDDLGLAFISGFTRQSPDPKVRNQYNTLSRTAAFSRQLSLFFKYYLNFLLEGKEDTYNIPVESGQNARKKVVTVYSGGDDVFLIGNIKDILESAIMIQDSFSRYTCKTLSISFGIGIYPARYPIYRSAVETEELESLAKSNDGKNSISLFTTGEDHSYRLDIFKKNVLDEKFALLNEFFGYNNADKERGNAFLYRLMHFIKSSDDKINIARYAYLLARMEPIGKNEEYRNLYQKFSNAMYGWILKAQDRKELLTAIYIYIYLTRKRSEQ